MAQLEDTILHTKQSCSESWWVLCTQLFCTFECRRFMRFSQTMNLQILRCSNQMIPPILCCSCHQSDAHFFQIACSQASLDDAMEFSIESINFFSPSV